VRRLRSSAMTDALGGYTGGVDAPKLVVEFDREEDGRWIAEVLGLPGVMVYGASRDEALAKAEVLALRVLAEPADS
jgi:hypothetical protein